MSAERDNARISFLIACGMSIAWIVGTATDLKVPDHPVLYRLSSNVLIWIFGGGFLATWNKWRETK